MAFYDAEQRRLRHAQADLIDAVSIGYAGCRSDKGIHAKQRIIETLRRD